LALFREKLLGRGYISDFPGAEKSFCDTETDVKIEVITASEFPGDGLPKPAAFPDPEDQTIVEDNVRVIILEKLIELKLASGLSATHRMRDLALADIQDLFIVLNLPLNLMDKLDKSVRTVQFFSDANASLACVKNPSASVSSNILMVSVMHSLALSTLFFAL